MEETQIRSLSKGIIWRIVSLITLIIITYVFTGDLIAVTLITLLSNIVFIVVFFLHERMWLRIQRPRGKLARSIAKMFTYITILGVIIMSTITYLVTQSIQTATEITLTYIIVKHIMYIFNELIWYRIQWGGRAQCQN